MKFTHKLCGAALLAVVGVALVVPNNTKADDGVGLEGGAEIEFTETSSTTPPTNPPGGSNSGPISGTSGTSDAGTFGISYVTGLDFGKHENMTKTGIDTYWAKKWVATNNDGKTIENAHFVNFNDSRQQKGHAYVIQAKLTKEFSSTLENGDDVKLNGVSLTYNNPSLIANGETAESLAPTAGLKPGAVVTKDAQTIMLDNSNPADEEIGFGYFTLMFGQYALGDADGGAGKSISLTIPKADNRTVYNTKYQGGVTWTMSVTPQP